MRSAASIILLLCLPVVLQAGERTFERQFTVAPGGKLTVRTDYGDVTVKGTSSGEVRVAGRIRGSASELEEFEFSAEREGNNITVHGKGTNEESWWKADIQPEVSLTVEVPGEFNVDLSTAGGDVTVEHLTGAITGSTSGGDVTVRNVRGDALLETSGGDIVAAELAGNLNGETSGGDIMVRGLSGSANVETSGGDIRISGVSGSVNAETSGGDIVVHLTGDNKGVTVQTSGGDIEIRTTGSIAADLDASTSGGSVVCNLPVTLRGEIDESRIRGTINGGGELIRARTSGGDIRIGKSE